MRRCVLLWLLGILWSLHAQNYCTAAAWTTTTIRPIPSTTRQRHTATFFSSLASTTSSSSSSSPPSSPTLSNSSSSPYTESSQALWHYPRRIQDSMSSTRCNHGNDSSYASVVASLYVRQIVVETHQVATMAVQLYLDYCGSDDKEPNNNWIVWNDDNLHNADNADADTDPFDKVAAQVSMLHDPKVGWIDNHPEQHGNVLAGSSFTHVSSSLSLSLLLPLEVQGALFALSPKAGDVHILRSNQSQYHVVKVDELALQLPYTFRPHDNNHNDNIAAPDNDCTTTTTTNSSSSSSAAAALVGSHFGINAVLPRSKLKGHGVLPTTPSFDVASSTDDDANHHDDGDNHHANSHRSARRLKTYVIKTAGCQMNVADTERMAGVLEGPPLFLKPAATTSSSSSSDQTNNKGATTTTTTHQQQQLPDVVIFNTCTIRDHAEQKLYDALGPYRQEKRKRAGKHFALVVTGCVAQQEGEALLKRIPEVDVVMGPQYVPHLANVLQRVKMGHQVVATAPMIQQEHQQDTNFLYKPIRGHDLKAWVNVIYGCNEHCTYCVVPAVRGMEQSRPMENILQECLDLQQSGYKEITLLGQNIDAYGRDMVPKRTFCDLLHYLNANLVPRAGKEQEQEGGQMRIRYVTSHPRYFSDRVINAVADLDKVCECFHMPFQAGDNGVLKNMRRGYTYESYIRIIDKIRAKAPDAAICGDVIVGFPGETDEAFQRTLDLMREVRFDNLNTFAYSPRPNTEAALWDNQVPEDVKSERLQIVQKLAAEHGLERSTRYVDRTVEVLVEDGNPRNPTQCMGRTRQGRQVFFDGDLDELRGKFVQVRITTARTWSLMGELA